MCTLIRRCVGDAAADLGLHFLHMSEGPFSHDTDHIPVFELCYKKIVLPSGI